MSGLDLKIPNLDKVLSEVKAYPQDVEKIINNEFKAFGNEVQSKAQKLAPVDEGELRRRIYSQAGQLEVTIIAGVDYAAFVEFGTKSFAAEYVGSLPPEWQQYAATFKGKKMGSFEQFLKALVEWVHRKGITGTYSVKTRKRTGSKDTQASEDRQAAYLIARKILLKGIPAQPFMYPAFEASKKQLIDNLKKQLNVKS